MSEPAAVRDPSKGAQAIADWFGEWPSFHDAEVLELHLARRLRPARGLLGCEPVLSHIEGHVPEERGLDALLDAALPELLADQVPPG